MGLDGLVYCRCWQDGIAATPPCAPDLVEFDDEGWLNLLLPYDGNEGAHRAFEGWVQRGCPHAGMAFATEALSNWSGYRRFQDALTQVGYSRFPTLLSELPDANGGLTSAATAGRMLAELDGFEQRTLADEPVLIDEATGAVVMSYVKAYQGVTIIGPDHRAGVDSDGFFVQDDSDPPVLLFRSTHFSQRVVDGRLVEFSDRSCIPAADEPPDKVRIAMSPIACDSEDRIPERLRTETRHRTGADLLYIVTPLRTLCRAAITTGNPVLWC